MEKSFKYALGIALIGLSILALRSDSIEARRAEDSRKLDEELAERKRVWEEIEKPEFEKCLRRMYEGDRRMPEYLKEKFGYEVDMKRIEAVWAQDEKLKKIRAKHESLMDELRKQYNLNDDFTPQQ